MAETPPPAPAANVVNEVRCPLCEAEFPESAIEGALCCPSCKGQVPPQIIAHDVTVTLNWQDFRILANWARSWQMIAVAVRPEPAAHLDRICRKLEAVRPAGAPELKGGG